MLTVADLAAGAPALDLDERGTPRRPAALVDLDSAAQVSPAAVAAAAVHADCALPALLGVCQEAVPDEARPLLPSLDVCLTGHPDHAPQAVCPVGSGVGESIDDHLADILARCAAAPRATVMLAGLLRQTAVLDVRRGLLAESAVYSTLLAGPEFGAWLRRRDPSRGPPHATPEPVEVSRDGDLLRVRLARPGRRNAVDSATRDALVDAFELALLDPRLHVELTGAGPDFCTGGDLDTFGSAPDVATAHVLRAERSPGWLLHVLRDRATARLHGRCLGAGVEIPAFAGRVVARPGTRFGLPELGLGLIPGAGGCVSVTARIGRWRTAWLVLSGRDVDVRVAVDWGLVDDVEPLP